MPKMEYLAGIALAASTALAATTAEAAFVWNFGGGTGNQVLSSQQFSATVGGKTVAASVTAWADSGLAGDNGNRVLNQGHVYQYGGGLGVQWVAPTGTTINGLSQESTSVPEHTMDNCGLYSGGGCTAGTPEDFILFKFSDSVALSQVAQGWYQTDADITVLAYTGSGDPTPNLTKDTYDSTDAKGVGVSAGLVKDGWQFIGNYADLQNGPATINTGANTAGKVITSSYWLIGAYNSRVSNSGWTNNNDFLKIVSLAGSVTPPGGRVPEPSSVALAVLGLAAVRRYRTRPG